MKVVVDMQKVSNLYSGLGQFCFHLGKELINQNNAGELLFLGKKQKYFDNRVSFFEISLIDKITGKLPEGIDIWHCTHQEPEFVPENIPYILTIHDLNFLYKYKSEWKINIKIKKLQKLISEAAAIVAVSEFTLKEINNNFFLPDVPQQVIYNGISIDKNVHGVEPDFTLTGPFLFSIGIITAKKNFKVLVPFIKKLNYMLIIAGDNKTEYAKDIIKEAERLGVRDKIILTGKISEEEKVWFYKNCEAFVFPSISEGFGLPVAEAMSLGKPVFLSDKTSLPEIGGDAAFYWTDFEPGYMVDVYRNKINIYTSDINYRTKIIEQSNKFSWEEAARQYLALYSSLANKKDRKH